MKPHAGLGIRAAALLALLLGANACAQPATDESLKKIEALAKESASAPLARRGDLLEQSIKARAELIALGASDERLATWLLDQADAVLQLAGRDGAELAVLYGVPTTEQRTRLRQAGGDAGALVEQAARAAEDGVAKLETELFAARGDAARVKTVAARVEPRLRILVDVEQAWRLPMLRSSAALISAASMDGQAGALEQRKTAAGAAEVLAGIRGPDERAEVVRLLWRASAVMLAGDRLEAAHQFAEVEPLASDIMTGEQARLGLAGAAVDLIAAREAARLLERASAQAPISLDLLRSEAAARAILRHAPEGGDANGGAARGASRVGAGGGAVPRRRHRRGLPRMVVEKIARLTDEGVDIKEMEPAIIYARAVAILEGRASGGAESATALLARVADGDGPALVREAALWAVGTRPGVEKLGGKARIDAGATLSRLARDFPGSPHARDALVRAEALLRAPAAQKAPGSLPLQREVIRAALDLRPPLSNAAELASVYMGNFAMDETQVMDAPALQQALAMLPVRGDDHAEQRAGDERNAWIVIERAILAAKEQEPVARTAAAWAIAHSPALAARARVVWAEALLEKGEASGSIEQINAVGALDKAPLTDADRTRAPVDPRSRSARRRR